MTFTKKNKANYSNEKIRSGQPFLYREGGIESMVMDIRMKESICKKSLQKALDTTLQRYPYFTSKFLEKNGDFYLIKNSLPFIVKETPTLQSLGSDKVNNHLIDVTFFKQNIYISFHHGLCDGRGILPFIETLIYYYCCYKYNQILSAPGVRLASEPLLPNETVEPLKNSYSVTAETELLKIVKDGFALPESPQSLGKNNYYRYEIKLEQSSFMQFAKENKATPAIVMALFVAKAIKKVHPNLEETIVGNLASDLRNGIHMENTFRNCVGSIELPYSSDFEQLTFKEQSCAYRELITEHKNKESIKKNVNKMIHLFDQVDTLITFEEKKKMLSFFNELITNTFVLSYVGQLKIGECENYIDSFYLYGSGTTGLTMEMLAFKDSFTIAFMQSFVTEKYIHALAEVMKEAGLQFTLSEQIKFDTPKDSINGH